MSENFGKNERKLAVFLSRTPVLKQFLKRYYSLFSYLFYRKTIKFKTILDIFEISIANEESFFGYYDKSPLNSNGKYVVFHSSANSTKRLPNPNNYVNVVLMDFHRGEILDMYKSSAFNWQQGTKLQWLDDSRFIFNYFDEHKKKYISKIVNALDKSVIVIDFPIYDTFKTFGISLSFDRLAMLRPDYGYRNRLDQVSFDLTDLKNDGVFYVDLEKNAQKLILTLEKIINVEYSDSMKQALHKVNHIMISPDGSKFVFLHRFFVEGLKYDRLLISNIDGSGLCVLSDHDMTSHFFWKDNDTIVVFMRRFEHGDMYYEINILTGGIQPLGKGNIDKYGDGHPNCLGNKMLFDTYPNKARMKEMFIFNFDDATVIKLGEFFESLKYGGETRCDLHQRWSEDGKYIFFDSVHTGSRKLYYMKVNK